MPTKEKIRVDFSSIPNEADALVHYPWETMMEQGYHWMDRFGNAYWIRDMETSYLENALRFARHACRGMAYAWFLFAVSLNGEMAIDSAERYAGQYDDEDVPLIKGLRNELARRRGEDPPYGEYELSYYWDPIKDQGWDVMPAFIATRTLGEEIREPLGDEQEVEGE